MAGADYHELPGHDCLMHVSANEARKQSRIVVHLPEADYDIEVRRYTVRKMLETGMGALIRDYVEDSDCAEEQAAIILENAKRVLVASSTKPDIIFEETELPSQLCIKDLSDEDIIYAFEKIVTVDDSRFFGTNRTAFDADKLDQLLSAQMTICAQVDGICQRYGLSPLEVERWTDDEFARVRAIIEAAEHLKRKHEDNG